MHFEGYRRTNGAVGTRNYVGILSTVVCANEVADGIARQVGGTAAFMHQQGCCQTPVDIERVNQTLIGLGRNPNLSSVVLVTSTVWFSSAWDVKAPPSGRSQRAFQSRENVSRPL